MTGWVNIANDSDIMSVLFRPGSSTSSDSNSTNYNIIMYHDYIDFEYVPFDDQTSQISYRFVPDSSMKNKWVHIGITFDTNEVRWYYNGKMVMKEQTRYYNGNDMAHGTGNLMIGSDGEYFLVGAIDELKLYNYKLSAKEVEADYKEIDTLSISKENETKIKSLKKNDTVKLTTTRKSIVTGKSSTVTNASYKSSNKKVFTVNNKGEIKAVGKGSATLTITHGGITKTYKVTVK